MAHCDWSAYDEIRVVLTAATTFTFAGAIDGQGCVLKLRQDGAGGKQATLPPAVRFNAAYGSYSQTTSAGVADKVGFIYDGGDDRYDFVSLIPGIGS